MKAKKEKWVDLIYFGHKYEISSNGIIRNKLTKKIYKTQLNTSGYEQISLHCNNKKITIPVHRLEYLSFFPHTPLSNDIHHLDGNKLNNKLSNLGAIDKRVHCSIHIRERIKAGTWNLNKTKTHGQAHPRFKGTVIAICPTTNQIIHRANGTLELKNLGFSSTSVSQVILGKQKKYKGLIFKRLPIS